MKKTDQIQTDPIRMPPKKKRGTKTYSTCPRNGAIRVLKKMVIHFQAFWGPSVFKLTHVCVWVCV